MQSLFLTVAQYTQVISSWKESLRSNIRLKSNYKL